VLTTAALPATAEAKGKHDPSFGVGGRAVRDVSVKGSSLSGPFTKAAESADGRTFVLVNESVLLAFEPSGQPDLGFGSGGSLTIFGPGEQPLGPVGLAADPGGRVLVTTTIDPPPEPMGSGTVEFDESGKAILVARYTTTGQPDPSFGRNGRVVTKLGFGFARPRERGGLEPIETSADGIAVDLAGRILLSGTHLAGYEPCPNGSSRPQSEAFVARLTEDGQPDPSFGRGGATVLREAPIGAPVPDESGGVYASVGTPMPCEISRREAAGYLFHLDAAGTPIPGFGLGGWRFIPEDPGVKMLPDGHGGVVLMPSSAQWRRELALRRLRADGSWDRRFGQRSVAEPFPSAQGTLAFSDAAIGSSGQIYVTGTWTRKARGAGAKHRFLLFRLGRRGQLDHGYGVVRTGFGEGTAAFSRSLLIAPGGKPLLVGAIRNPLLSGGEGIALARYLAAPRRVER
jgi:uncharacterized delta-60 repeat protein